jgi:site-specific DNA recombinase
MTDSSITHWNDTQIRIAKATPLRAAIYIRVSTKNQEKGYSLETQLEGCKKYCQERGYIVEEIHIYRETMTGVIYREREILNKLRAAARRKEFDVVVVYDVDRLSRDPVHQLIISDELTEHGVRLESVLREIDDSDEGQLIQFTRGYAGKLEYERLRDRLNRGIMARAAEGHLRPGGRPLYGYEWVDTKKVKKSAYVFSTKKVGYVDGNGKEWTESNVVKFIWARLKEGCTQNSIAVRLNEMGVPPPENKGKKIWRQEAISRIANNPFYAGIAYAHTMQYTKEPGGKMHKRLRPEEERIRLPDGVIPPYVDMATFEAIQIQLELHRQRAPRNNKNPSASLLHGGFAKCGYCGLTMRTHRRIRETRKDGSIYELWYYECPYGENPNKLEKCKGNPQVKVETLDDAVWAVLRHKINHPQEVQEEVRNELEAENFMAREAESIQNSLREVEAEQQNLLAGLPKLDPRYAGPIYEKLNRLATLQAGLEKELKEVDSSLKTEEEIEQEIENFKEWCKEFRERVDQENAPYDEKRRAVERFNVEVIVYNRDPETKKPVYEINASPVIVRRSLRIAALVRRGHTMPPGR